MIHQQRIQALNSRGERLGEYVLYWMQASQRAEYNHALEYSISRANKLRKPVVVFFGIASKFPEANLRHYHFMFEGLREVAAALAKRGIRLVIRRRSPEKGVISLGKRASLVVVDRGYLRIQRAWRDYAARHLGCPLIQVESDVVVPVQEASPKEEFSAATFRPKIKRKLTEYLVPLRPQKLKVGSLHLDFDSIDLADVDNLCSKLRIDRSVPRVYDFRGGTGQAKRLLRMFIRSKLDQYDNLRNDPNSDYVSNLSPYLHFGQISPLYVALQILSSKGPGKEAYLEELIVRRELSMNFVFYSEDYDSYGGLPDWAKKTLRAHEKDKREYVYSPNALEHANTHDPYWNAAQMQMMITGKMHGYMRMYWGKKILEWSKTPEEGFRMALYLNNKYEVDGRDPNGFAGVAWCFGKHDRPWGEREIFGKVRYMNAAGLGRKFDADAYVDKIADLKRTEQLDQ